jgi:hypothetical protein
MPNHEKEVRVAHEVVRISFVQSEAVGVSDRGDYLSLAACSGGTEGERLEADLDLLQAGLATSTFRSARGQRGPVATASITLPVSFRSSPLAMALGRAAA